MSIIGYEERNKQDKTLQNEIKELLEIAQKNNYEIKIDIHLERERPKHYTKF